MGTGKGNKTEDVVFARPQHSQLTNQPAEVISLIGKYIRVIEHQADHHRRVGISPEQWW